MVKRKQFIDTCNRIRDKLEQENPVILRYADDLNSRIGTERGQVKYLRGLMVMASLTDDRFYRSLTVATLISVINRGVDWDLIEDAGFNSAEIVNAGSISVEEAARVSVEDKKSGKKVGLMHGHFRTFTPGSLLNVVLASETCDLFLGLERNWRTRRYKHAEPICHDRLRENIMVLFPGLADHLVAINRIEYSDEGYRRMVKAISPDIYFGNAGNSIDVREEMAYRAQLVRAEYRELDYIPGFSTSEYLDLGGRTEPNFALLLGKRNVWNSTRRVEGD